jgi:hypothetical protein
MLFGGWYGQRLITNTTYSESLDNKLSLKETPVIGMAIKKPNNIPIKSGKFIRTSIGHGASIEIPKNWIVLSDGQKITIDTFVKSSGYRLTESSYTFAANLYDEHGKTMALVHVRFYPDNPFTQKDARQFTSNDLNEIGVGLKKGLAIPKTTLGIKMTNWFGIEKKVISGLYVIVHEHQNSGINEKNAMRVRGVRVLQSPHSFTLTLSYRERDAKKMLPIIDFMTNSLRQE